MASLLTLAVLAGSARDLQAQYRNDSAELYAAIAAHIHDASGQEPVFLIGDPRIWGILPRRVVQSIVTRLESRGIAALDCRAGCAELSGDVHLAFGPIAFQADSSAWVTVDSFRKLRDHIWRDRTAYRVEYREERWRVVESRSAWTI